MRRGASLEISAWFSRSKKVKSQAPVDRSSLQGDRAGPFICVGLGFHHPDE